MPSVFTRPRPLRFRPRSEPIYIPALAPRGLKLAFLPDWPKTREYVSGTYAGQFNSTPQRPRLLQNGFGLFLNSAIGAAGNIIAYDPANLFSLEVLLWYGGPDTHGRVLCSFTAANPPGSTYDRILYIESGVPKFEIYTGTIRSVVGTSALPIGELSHLVGISDGVSIYLFVNSVSVATGTGGTAYAGNHYFAVGETGNAPGSFVHTANVQLLAINYAEAVWTAEEVAARYADPFSFYRWPARAQIPTTPPVVSSINLDRTFGQFARSGLLGSGIQTRTLRLGSVSFPVS